MSPKKRILLSALTGLLLAPAWYEWGNGLFLLVALIPLLFVEDFFDKNQNSYPAGAFFRHAALSFFVWNVLATWWIVNATVVGVFAAIFINTLMWSFVMWLFHIVKRKMGSHIGYFSLILFWITWEYFYHNSEISWPWLTLGNGFAYNIKMIQWYEYTGVLGGSLWVLMVNVLLFNFLQGLFQQLPKRLLIARLVVIGAIIAGPLAFSIYRFYTYEEKPDPKNIVVIQPNIDPYQKFVSIPSIEQTQTQLAEAIKVADTAVDYFIAPETSISNNSLWIGRFNEVEDIQMIRNFLRKFPGASYVPGIQCYKLFEPGEPLTENARDLPGTSMKYAAYNAAVQIDTSPEIPYYFKSKLVVGVETMPYARYLGFLEGLTVKLGGTLRGWGTQDTRGVFYSAEDSTGVSPIICYESVYGEFVTGYVKNGAELLFVITNDGWWGDTPGYHQHNSLSSLRAVETRRSVARSANTGISCLINQKGEVLQQLGWWKEGVIKGTVNANDALTFYVKNGDYIGKSAAFFSALIVLIVGANVLMKRPVRKG